MARTTPALPPSSYISPFRQSTLSAKQQTQSQQKVKNTSTHTTEVYRPTSIRCHPDTGFESGAWLFDTSVAPHWFTSLLSPHTTQSNPTQYSLASARSIPSHCQSGANTRDDTVSAFWENRDIMMAAFGPDNLITTFESRRQRVPTPFPTTFLVKEPPSYQFMVGRPTVTPPSLSATKTTVSKPMIPKYEWPDSDFLITTFNTVCSGVQDIEQDVSTTGVIPVGSIKAQHWSPEDGFESGAWLFDESIAPWWLVCEINPTLYRKSSRQQSSSFKRFPKSSRQSSRRPQKGNVI